MRRTVRRLAMLAALAGFGLPSAALARFQRELDTNPRGWR